MRGQIDQLEATVNKLSLPKLSNDAELQTDLSGTKILMIEK